MNDFNYYAPTKVVFGKGAEQNVGKLVKEQNCKKVLIHYGSGSARRSGLLDRIEAIFEKEGIAYTELGGVVPNPRLSLVYEGIGLCKKENVDFILAVGGGSVIDSAKAIGYGVANEGDVWDFFDFKRKPTACLPIGTVLTIAAAGSEMSGSCVITKEEGGMKRGCTTDYSRLKFAVLNPELTLTLPSYQTACGCTDILMHTMERYFNHSENMELTDGISEALMRTVIRNAKILVKEPENYDARAEVMWAGSLSHNGLTGCGTDGGDWATHKLEHELGGMFDVAHGAGLAAIWGSWARYVCGERIDRFVQFAERVMDVTPQETEQKTAEAGIAAMEDFYREIKMPTSLAELGIAPTDEQIRELAEKCNAAVRGNLGKVKHLNVEDMIAIYTAARR
ncbi:MAG TPA: NADH-dependent alcohol dehydrogenase [Roseburia sp.]|nr:NADH-dependent alcohol dehydrogenase [Roseburia sp.]